MAIITTGFTKTLVLTVSICAVSGLAGCGGTKLLKEPRPVTVTQALSGATDSRIEASLDWVIVRGGAGSWAKNADWDEYLVTVTNQAEAEIRIIEVTVTDSLGTLLANDPNRKRLVKASKKTSKRYRDSNLKVKAGLGAGTLIVAGAAAAAVGTAVAVGSVQAAVYSGSAAAGGAAATAGAVVLLAPALVLGGFVRAANNGKVQREIESRHSPLPLTVSAGSSAALDLFFPLAPSPTRVEISYELAGKSEMLFIDTSEALDGLHLLTKDK